MQVVQYKLSIIYETIFNCFRKGEYYIRNLSKKSPNIDETQRPKKALSESKSHEAAVDFITYLFCVKSDLKYHRNYYKKLYIPWGAGKISLHGIEFQEFVDFISPETKKTKSKRL
jgi:hypothetical protein